MQLDLPSLAEAYARGTSVQEVLDWIGARIAQRGAAPVWITLTPPETLRARAAALTAARDAGARLPLFGVPFAVKDNIDVAGLPTSCACPDFAHMPAANATVVTLLEQAGAIVIGKTNLDQFATGLVGTRSPYGAPHSVFSTAHVSGGSSSGSAVSVAAGLVSFALGTDTAGSGRVPAAFNNIVGLKPSRGALSLQGVMPACKSIDCLSIFANTAADAAAVWGACTVPDGADPYSRAVPAWSGFDAAGSFRFAVPAGALPDDAEAVALHEAAIARLVALGGVAVTCDFTPFAQAAALLYQGPFVAERLAALQSRGFTRWERMDPQVAAIISAATTLSAADVFAGLDQLAALRAQANAVWQQADVMLLPTAPHHPTLAEVAAAPIAANARLGRFTNFVNLLDLAAIAVPAGFTGAGLPYGVTLVGPWGADVPLAQLAARLHAAAEGACMGASAAPVPHASARIWPKPAYVELAVVGAHLTGQPLNHQLSARGAHLLRTTRTSVGYALYALTNTTPPKPGLVRDGTSAGLIEVEVWRLTHAAFGAFTEEVPAPLAIGTVTLQDGSTVKGFVCESAALHGAQDITRYGGWRAFRADGA